jgi:hypothetical protein
MEIPSSFSQVLVFVLLVVPGIAYIAARDLVLGTRASSISVPARILEALFISVIFDVAYLVILGGFFPGVSAHNFRWVADNLQWAALIALGVFLVIPALIAFVGFGKPTVVPSRRWPRLKRPSFSTNFVNIPTAWDRVASRFETAQFVRVRLEDGKWIGGWFATDSFVSTYPEPRDMFIESEWVMSRSGAFIRPVPDRTGVWLAITESRIVEWIGVPAPTDDTQGAEDGKRPV